MAIYSFTFYTLIISRSVKDPWCRVCKLELSKHDEAGHIRDMSYALSQKYGENNENTAKSFAV